MAVVAPTADLSESSGSPLMASYVAPPAAAAADAAYSSDELLAENPKVENSYSNLEGISSYYFSYLLNRDADTPATQSSIRQPQLRIRSNSRTLQLWPRTNCNSRLRRHRCRRIFADACGNPKQSMKRLRTQM